jgi:hypothetical protein
MNDVRFEVHNLLINARAQSKRQGNSFVPRARKTAKPHTKAQQQGPTSIDQLVIKRLAPTDV